MASPCPLALTPPVGSYFLLEIRQLKQLLAGQPERGVHHQAGLLKEALSISIRQNIEFCINACFFVAVKSF